MTEILLMEKNDTEEVLNMMKLFYQSPAIIHKASEDVLRRDIEDCIGSNPFIEGFVMKEDGKTAGYSMIAKSYSTEFGGECIWVEDIYIKSEYRKKGIGTMFFKYLENLYKGRSVRFRLEVEKDNQAAIEVYKKNGYQELPYIQMIKEF